MHRTHRRGRAGRRTARIVVGVEAALVVRGDVVHGDDEGVRDDGAVATAQSVEVSAEIAGGVGAVAVDHNDEGLGDHGGALVELGGVALLLREHALAGEGVLLVHLEERGAGGLRQEHELGRAGAAVLVSGDLTHEDGLGGIGGTPVLGAPLVTAGAVSDVLREMRPVSGVSGV